jgi:gliding motility-associated protein GldM
MSPVQRTITLPVLLAVSIFIAVFFTACVDKIKTDLNVYKALDEGLVNSNIVIHNGSLEECRFLEDKTLDPETSDRAKRWYPKAKLIQELSGEVYNYIEVLKTDLKNESGLKSEGGNESFREADKNAVVHLFDRKGKGEDLYKRLQKYKTDIMAIDSQITYAFDKTILIISRAFESSENKQQDFTKTFFDDIPAIAALAMLSKFQNNVRITENRMVNFCNNHSCDMGIIYDTYSAIITQSSSYVRTGEEIVISAGIGGFSKAALPKIIIDNKDVQLGYGGSAIYKFNAPAKPGKHIVPVQINYIDQDGQKQTIIRNIEYTVAKETDINN